MKINLDSTLIQLVDREHELKPQSRRKYLGASVAGHPCDRYLWFYFRGAKQEQFSGRMLRLFRRGHLEESTVVQDLRAAGMQVENCLDDQVWLQIAPHIGGHPDGMIKGVPEAPKTWHVLEIKTHSLKSFADLAKGVEKSKPQHYAQMQLYMHAMHLNRALYYAVCKNDDHIYIERVKLDQEYVDRLIRRLMDITRADYAPAPISKDPAWYECQYCLYKPICHGVEPSVEITCHTCAHSTCIEDGWRCERWQDMIPDGVERCDSHVWHPDLVPWEMVKGVGDWSVQYGDVVNGEDGLSSGEMLIEMGRE